MIGPELYSFRALWRQYRSCRRNKRNSLNALAFEVDAEANLLQLQAELRAHTYRPGRSICFITGGPKPREVFAADFRDRIVHHLLVGHQERVFEPRFIHDSYACRPGKGTLAASDRLMTFLRRETANGQRTAWALKLDVASFFPTIHKATLYDLLAARQPDPELRWLTRVLLFHDPTTNYCFRSLGVRTALPGTPGYPVPPIKSLFGKRNERGLPIGNLTSQFWGNVYLNELDQFVKRRLRVRHYLRYVDDLVLLDTDRARLAQAGEAIGTFLRERLRLDLRQDGATPVPARRGIDFVGWRAWWNRRLRRRRTVGNMRTKLHAFASRQCRPGPVAETTAIPLAGEPARLALEGLRASLASYSGHLRHGNAWGEWDATWARQPWLGALFVREGWTFTPRWQMRPIHARRFRDQYWALVGEAGESTLVFWPVGRFVEFYGLQRLLAERVLGLRATYLPRAGFGFVAGFPRARSWEYACRATEAGLAVLLVGAGPAVESSGPRQRWPVRLLVPESLARCSRPASSPTGIVDGGRADAGAFSTQSRGHAGMSSARRDWSPRVGPRVSLAISGAKP